MNVDIKASAIGETQRIAFDLERIADVLRSAANDCVDGRRVGTVPGVLDNAQLQLSEVVASVSLLRQRATAEASRYRSSQAKERAKQSQERLWKAWEEITHEQSANEPFHVFLEHGENSSQAYLRGKLIGFIFPYNRNQEAYGIRSPVKTQLKGIFSSVEEAVDRLRQEFDRMMLERGYKRPQ